MTQTSSSGTCNPECGYPAVRRGYPALRRKIFPLFFRFVISVLPLAHFPSMGSDDPPPPPCLSKMWKYRKILKKNLGWSATTLFKVGLRNFFRGLKRVVGRGTPGGPLIFFRKFSLIFTFSTSRGEGGGSPDPILGNYLFPSLSRNDSGIRPKKKNTGNRPEKTETFSGKSAESFLCFKVWILTSKSK